MATNALHVQENEFKWLDEIDCSGINTVETTPICQVEGVFRFTIKNEA